MDELASNDGAYKDQRDAESRTSATVPVRLRHHRGLSG